MLRRRPRSLLAANPPPTMAAAPRRARADQGLEDWSIKTSADAGAALAGLADAGRDSIVRGQLDPVIKGSQSGLLARAVAKRGSQEPVGQPGVFGQQRAVQVGTS